MTGPTTIAILPTFQCTAACRDCCFGGTPKYKGRLDLHVACHFIDQCVEAFPALKVVVFPGGEPFLYGADLVRCVKHATEKGLSTRIVTNGYWAQTEETARQRLAPLVEAGLKEINFSTGDNHQEYVPFAHVTNGAMASAKMDLVTAVSVESGEGMKFKGKDALTYEPLRSFLETHEKASNLIEILPASWVAFGAKMPSDGRHLQNVDCPCSSILENFVLLPTQDVIACCGLPTDFIPEMRLGRFPDVSVGDLYCSQFEDFLKIWLFMDGPSHILNFARKKLGQEEEAKFMHQCEACLELYRTKEIRRALRQYHVERIPDVMFRFFMRKTLEAKTKSILVQENPVIA